MNKKQTRKEFLTNTSKYAVGAVVGVAGLNAVTNNKLFGGTADVVWPLPYVTIDPDEARAKAHYLYWNEKDCCSGVFGAFTELLKEKIGEPWTNIPMEIMLYGRGGGVGWGSLCGTPNGGAAVISTVVGKADSGPLISELWGWYCSEELPTDAANAFDYETKNYEGELPQNISGSPLCHVSVTEWCIAAGKKVSDIERKERCARVAGDTAAKVAELLNAYFAQTFTPTYTDPTVMTTCLACHGANLFNNVMTRMNCVSCHGDPHGASSVEDRGGVAMNYQLEQNYPNPFNPTTQIRFSIPEQAKVRLEVYDIRGALVQTLVDSEVYQPGNYQAKWNGTDALGNRAASGIYFARLTAGNFMKTIKMNLVK
jgi:hypothetical protein